MLRRVARVATAGEATRRDGVELWTLVPPERGSELALVSVRLEPGATLSVDDALHDTLLLVHAGAGTLDGAPLEGRCAGLVAAGRTGTLTAGAAGLECVTATAGAETDLHAPMGAAETAVALDHVEPGQATGARSFQVLYGPHNGSTRATLFVGYIPPGKAPWHYHLYDEIVWVPDGPGRLHLEGGSDELAAGAAFRLRPRQVHIVENASDSEMTIIGIFTPAGSPSAAYLTADVAAEYRIAG